MDGVPSTTWYRTRYNLILRDDRTLHTAQDGYRLRKTNGR